MEERKPLYRVIDTDTLVIMDCFTELGKEAYLEAIKMAGHTPFVQDFTKRRAA